MTWLIDLYKEYEKNKDFVGKREINRWGKEITLLPVSHTTQTAHIQVNITEKGQYHSAIVLGKEDKCSTVIPCTLESASRSSNTAPYPLHDKLCYVAGDFVAYGGEAKTKKFIAYDGKQVTGGEFLAYSYNLGLWASSPESHWKVKAIYEYISKKCLIKDLIDDDILFIDDNNQLIKKWDKKYEEKYGTKPDIFSAITGDQTTAFVRFNVNSRKDLTEVWSDQEVYNSFITFYNNSLQNLEHNLCYITGKKAPITKLHANKIRNAADKSKLISSNDESGFTYKGRFESAKQAANISYEASQKSHNALKWLISRQGDTIGGRVFLIWGNDIPSPLDNNSCPETSTKSEEDTPDTDKEYAMRVNKALHGYRRKLNTMEQVNILILDAATTGRLAVTYYQKLDKKRYIERLENWFKTCKWRFRVKSKESGKMIDLIQTPTPKEISKAIYGTRDDKLTNKLIKETVQRILICMLENKDQLIPKDIERSLIIRASRPTSMENREWEKCLSVACAIIKHNRKKEEIEMTLDLENKDRSYLFGRLLAVADVAEQTVLDLNNDKRPTNAMRYMTAFSNQPEKTWKIIRVQLQPYLIKLEKESRENFLRLIDEITNDIGIENFTNEQLNGLYLVGLSSQRQVLNPNKQEINEE